MDVAFRVDPAASGPFRQDLIGGIASITEKGARSFVPGDTAPTSSTRTERRFRNEQPLAQR